MSSPSLNESADYVITPSPGFLVLVTLVDLVHDSSPSPSNKNRSARHQNF